VREQGLYIHSMHAKAYSRGLPLDPKSAGTGVLRGGVLACRTQPRVRRDAQPHQRAKEPRTTASCPFVIGSILCFIMPLSSHS
jgi:hypothetical protein